MIALTLLGLIPILMTVYLFMLSRIVLTEMIIFFSAVALISILAGYSLLRTSSDRLIGLSKQTTKILKNGGEEPIKINAENEINEIAENFNSMMNVLTEAQHNIRNQSVQLMRYANDLSKSYRRIREEEELKEQLSKYVGENVVGLLLESQGGVLTQNERREVTVLFADIRAFSTIAEKMAAHAVINMLNEFFSIMVEIIFRNNGVLDKFIGDQIMAVFGLIPSTNGMPHYNAINTALELQNATETLMKKRGQEDKETFEIGIGVNTGDAVIGNVGSENRKNYTVIGDSVNVAGRLQQLAEGGEIIIGEKTYDLTKDQFNYLEMNPIKVKNRIKPVTCYKLIR